MNKYKKNVIIIGISIFVTFAVTGAIHMCMNDAYKDIKTALSEDNNYEEELNAILNNKETSSEKITLDDINYEKYKELMKTKESFILYVGRQTCPDCRFFDEILNEIKIHSSIKHLSTQEYKDAISNNEPEAQKKYDDFKNNIGYEFIPYVCAVKEGIVISEFDFEFPEKMSELSEEETEIYKKGLQERFVEWLVKYQNMIQKTKGIVDDEACPIDERCQ